MIVKQYIETIHYISKLLVAPKHVFKLEFFCEPAPKMNQYYY